MENSFCQTCLIAALLTWAAAAAPGAETNPAPETVTKPATNLLAESEQQLRTYLKLQEQLHATLLAIEQARAESSLEMRTNAEVLSTRLEFLERSLAQQREQNLQTLRESNRAMLLMAGSIVGLGLLALAFAALFQSRGLNRLAEIATGFANERALLAGGLSGHSGSGGSLLLAADSAHGGNQSMRAAIDRLERRIQEMEDAAQPMLPFADAGSANGDGKPTAVRNGGAGSHPLERVSVLLGKGQALLSLGQAEAALTCFDEAVLVAPNHAEAQMKRGLALEKLKRLDEAVACYDRAIVLSPSLTQAYLCKGAVFNRLERFTEALACYEQALRLEAKA